MALPIEGARNPGRSPSRPVQDVKVFGIQQRVKTDRTKRPWIVRWSVDGPQHSRAFRTRVEADRFRSFLVQALQRGERFAVETGEPESWSPRAGDVQCHDWARRWLAEQWPEWQPRTRFSAVEALARFVPIVVVSGAPPAPPELRRYLVATLPPGESGRDEDIETWLEQASMRLNDLNRQLLASAEVELGLGRGGAPLAPSTANRFRKTAKACIRRAVELEIVPVDPWPPTVRGRSRRKAARVRRTVDVRRLPDPDTMTRALSAMITHQPASRTYQAMTAVAYYAGLRPSEVVMIRCSALVLPGEGWGVLDVREADISFDEPGEPKTGPRSVPIPPVLVELLRTWITHNDLSGDDLLFRTRTGRRPTASNWARSWQRALRTIGHPSLRVYDCRHAAATTWLRAGVPLAEIARRLGHSVEILVSTYVGVIEGDEYLANERIDAVLGRDGSPMTSRPGIAAGGLSLPM